MDKRKNPTMSSFLGTFIAVVLIATLGFTFFGNASAMSTDNGQSVQVQVIYAGQQEDTGQGNGQGNQYDGVQLPIAGDELQDPDGLLPLLNGMTFAEFCDQPGVTCTYPDIVYTGFELTDKGDLQSTETRSLVVSIEGDSVESRTVTEVLSSTFPAGPGNTVFVNGENGKSHPVSVNNALDYVLKHSEDNLTDDEKNGTDKATAYLVAVDKDGNITCLAKEMPIKANLGQDKNTRGMSWNCPEGGTVVDEKVKTNNGNQTNSAVTSNVTVSATNTPIAVTNDLIVTATAESGGSIVSNDNKVLDVDNVFTNPAETNCPGGSCESNGVPGGMLPKGQNPDKTTGSDKSAEWCALHPKSANCK